MRKELSVEIKGFAREKGAHIVGIASADRFANAPKGHRPEDLLPDAKSVVCIGMRYFHTILDNDRACQDSEILSEEDKTSLRKYMFTFLYDTDNAAMQVIGVHIAHMLSDKGYPSLPLPSSGWAGGPANVEGRSGRHGMFSHRHAAMLAGLGEIGLNNLLLTPEYGPRVRLNSVITSAPLDPDPLLKESVCLGKEKCGLCLKAPCFAEVEEWDVGGRRLPVAKLVRCNGLDPGCTDSAGKKLPFIRYCWGVCPAGRIK